MALAFLAKPGSLRVHYLNEFGTVYITQELCLGFKDNNLIQMTINHFEKNKLDEATLS